MRKLLLQIHLWISLLLGLFIVVICTTGSLLVIENDVEKWIHPQLYKPTPGRHALLLDVQQSVEQAFPGFKMDRIDLPTSDGLYQVRLSKDVNGKASTQNVYVDPGSAQVLGPVGPNRNVFFTKVLQIHRYLLAQDVLGKANASIVGGFMGIGLIIILVTGAYLWWPRIASFLMGMMPLFLMITGLVIWQFKARARRRSKSASRINEIPPKAMVPTMSSAE